MKVPVAPMRRLTFYFEQYGSSSGFSRRRRLSPDRHVPDKSSASFETAAPP
jgi:hypothetical protein